jgi:type VI secretion system protein ImpK
MDSVGGFYRSRIYTSDISINPLVVACDPILSLVTTLKNIEYPIDRNRFLEDLAHEIRSFEHRARIENYPENIITNARYVLCCLLDETIALTSEWGKNGGWLQNNLLTIFHNENYGGEHFFTIINRTLENIAANLHLIELLYLCLSFGFAGKHRNTEYGKNELAYITNNLYQIICKHRHTSNRNLFICDPKPEKNYEPVTTPSIKNIKLPRMAIIMGLFISSTIYLGIYLKLHDISKPLYSQIEYNLKDEN